MTSAKAYDLYLNGRYQWRKRSVDGMQRGLEFFRQAIAEDPEFAPAYVGVADSYIVDFGSWLGVSGVEALRIAREHIERALELDGDLAEAYVSRATVLEGELRWEAAGQDFRRALELNSDYPTAYQWYAEHLSILGRADEASECVLAGLEVDPFSLPLLIELGWVKLAAGDPEGALEVAQRVIEMDSNFFFGRLVYAFALHATAAPEADVVREMTAAFSLRWDFSEEQLATLQDAHEVGGWEGYWEVNLARIQAAVERGEGARVRLVAIYGQLGRLDEAFELIDELFEEHDPNLAFLGRTVFNEPLESDPRWGEVLRRLGLPQ